MSCIKNLPVKPSFGRTTKFFRPDFVAHDSLRLATAVSPVTGHK